ncbi:hypothetical protein DPMN_008541 [Dreissena polymorpha]|uniref:Uncharacterized protein n=1 Tax=Dreissena polymorpha TaxID=45954 RepID=A0A9D4MY99_DREPO|nr:hypothetical protein DPMN_008541 [Dreissena polymorpha]
MLIRSPYNCFTINSIFYTTNTRPLPELFSIHYLPDCPRPHMLTEPDQNPTACSGLFELI